MIVFTVRSGLSVITAFDVGAGIVNVGSVVHVPTNVMLSRVPFTILDVAVRPFGQVHPVEVILGG